MVPPTSASQTAISTAAPLHRFSGRRERVGIGSALDDAWRLLPHWPQQCYRVSPLKNWKATRAEARSDEVASLAFVHDPGGVRAWRPRGR